MTRRLPLGDRKVLSESLMRFRRDSYIQWCGRSVGVRVRGMAIGHLNKKKGDKNELAKAMAKLCQSTSEEVLIL